VDGVVREQLNVHQLVLEGVSLAAKNQWHATRIVRDQLVSNLNISSFVAAGHGRNSAHHRLLEVTGSWVAIAVSLHNCMAGEHSAAPRTDATRFVLASHPFLQSLD
jgi:hypothetical protein